MEWYVFLLIVFPSIIAVGFGLRYLHLKLYVAVSFTLQALIMSSLGVVEAIDGTGLLSGINLWLYWISFWGIVMQLECLVFVSWFTIYQYETTKAVKKRDIVQYACIIWGTYFFIGITICDSAYFLINGYDLFNVVDSPWLAPMLGGFFPAYYFQGVVGLVLLIIGFRWAFKTQREQARKTFVIMR